MPYESCLQFWIHIYVTIFYLKTSSALLSFGLLASTNKMSGSDCKWLSWSFFHLMIKRDILQMKFNKDISTQSENTSIPMVVIKIIFLW